MQNISKVFIDFDLNHPSFRIKLTVKKIKNYRVIGNLSFPTKIYASLVLLTLNINQINSIYLLEF